ncbi:transposase [Olleya sp. Bg11-27]|nr:transposase [Olleya sp. Bg11-27]
MLICYSCSAYGARKINTIGSVQAYKVMRLSAIAYNLKKYFKFVQNRAKREGTALGVLLFEIMALYKAINFHLSVSKLR